MAESPTLATYKLLHQVIEICHAHGVAHVVLCPGSRSAPLALSFMRFEGIAHYVIPDERSAAYTALGIARQTKKPVAIVCTSGTAVLNFGPAVAEAFFSEIPLIVFTADRPVEWLGQADNQAIFQANLYGKNVKASYTLPTESVHPDTEWYAIRIANEAMNTAKTQPKGPVHINVPLREPLYLSEAPVFEKTDPKKVEIVQSDRSLPAGIFDRIKPYQKIMVVAGTHRINKKLEEVLTNLSTQKKIVFVPDITSNLINIPGSVSFAEIIIDKLSGIDSEAFIPDLVISFGGPIVSKSLKNFLRNKAIKAHWHLSGHPASADTFQKLTHVFDIDSKGFFAKILQNNSITSNPEYYDKWVERDRLVKESASAILGSLPYSEISIAHEILSAFPENAVLHLGNSLPVRFASVFPFIKQGTEIYANRGTSGIDGTVSSTAGQSMVDSRKHVLICGDLSFMYDSNGLWNNYLKDNFNIIVFNNHGGGIFRTLPGAKAQKELEEYFVVKQPLNFEHVALQHNCHYFYANNLGSFKTKLTEFYAVTGKPAVFEVEFGENFTIAEMKGMVNYQ
jgi:2-succinyl-5-enolpyruvyl-6-hydroxy-3-cyclohexene-1-carboxylate synthase